MKYTGKFEVFENIIREIMVVYKHDERPWLIGYSGGKDSTLLVSLVYEAMKRLRDAGSTLNKRVYIVTSDTMVENPIVKNYMHSSSSSINTAAQNDGLNILATVIYPDDDQTFWSRVIGLGYPTPEPPGFRWCTERLKINPMNTYDSQQPVTEWERKRLDVLVNFLNFDIVYPILLAGAHLPEKKFAELVHMLEKFMFRYKTVCNLGHQKMSDLYMAEAVKIRTDPNHYNLSALRATLRNYVRSECTDEMFRAGLTNLKYRTSGNNKSLKYLFSTLNEHTEWLATGATGKPKPQTASVINYENVTIEHISSQADASPLPEFNGENVHRFYNLTILTVAENDRGKNKPYALKKPIYEVSAYALNKQFSTIAAWNYTEAKKWEEYLKDFACKVFVV